MTRRSLITAALAALALAGCATAPAVVSTGSLSLEQSTDATQRLLADTKVSFSTAVTTVAGTGTAGFMEGPAAMAKFNSPRGITVDAAGNLYVADTFNMAVRMITPAGLVMSVGFPMSLGKLILPRSVVVMPTGQLAVMENQKNRIQFLDAAGNVTPFVGGSVEPIAKGFLPGTYGYGDGRGPAARFSSMYDICGDGAGNLYVAERNRVRKIDPAGNVTTIAGIDKVGHVDGPGGLARFNTVKGICCDAAGTLYVVDSGNHRIRKLSKNKFDAQRVDVADIAGSDQGYADHTDGRYARFNSPTDIAVDSLGNLFVTDSGNHCIRKILPTGQVITLAGTRVEGAADGPGDAAQFSAPDQLTVDAAGNVYVTDLKNNKIRKIQQL